MLLPHMKNSAAFTLIELLLSITISSFLVAGIYSIVSRQTKMSQQNLASSQILRDLQRAHFLMKTDLARAGFDPRYADRPPPVCAVPRPTTSPCPLQPITIASNDRIVIHGDFNANGTIDNNEDVDLPETIDYLYDAQSHQTTRNGSPFLEGIADFSITYEDGSGSAVQDPQSNLDKIRRVRVLWSQETANAKKKITELLVIFKNHRV